MNCAYESQKVARKVCFVCDLLVLLIRVYYIYQMAPTFQVRIAVICWILLQVSWINGLLLPSVRRTQLKSDVKLFLAEKDDLDLANDGHRVVTPVPKHSSFSALRNSLLPTITDDSYYSEQFNSVAVFLFKAGLIGSCTGLSVVLFKGAIAATSYLFYEELANILPKPSFYWPLALYPVIGAMAVSILVYWKHDSIRRGIDFIARSIDATPYTSATSFNDSNNVLVSSLNGNNSSVISEESRYRSTSSVYPSGVSEEPFNTITDAQTGSTSAS